MATYTVSYRGKNGERIEEQFEAPDRNSLFKILADRKISAISVKDGAAPKRKKSSAPSKPLPPSVLRGAVAGIVVVALAGALFIVFGNRDEKPQEEKVEKSKLIKEVSPVQVVRKDKPVEQPKKRDPKVFSEPPLTPAIAKARRMQVIVAKHLEDPNWQPITNTPPKHIFQTGVEQVMSWIFNTQVGDVPPPLPALSNDELDNLATILVSKNEITKDDTELTAEQKANVDYAKEVLAQYIKDGGDIHGFLDHYRGQLMTAHQQYSEAQQAFMQMVHEDPELAYEYADKVNAMLKEKGIRPLRIPHAALARRGAFKPEPTESGESTNEQ